MSITISAEILPKAQFDQHDKINKDRILPLRLQDPLKATPIYERGMVLREENHKTGAIIEFKSNYNGSLNHDMIIHPIAALFMNEVYPKEIISSFSHFGESFVHGFQGVMYYGFDKLDTNGIYRIRELYSYLEVNCVDILPMSIEDIEKVVEFYYSGYFAAKEFLSNYNMLGLRKDLQIARQDFEKTAKILLQDNDDKELKYGLTYLSLPEAKFINKDKISIQVKTAMTKTIEVIKSVFYNQ
jgi:hypothetical protein